MLRPRSGTAAGDRGRGGLSLACPSRIGAAAWWEPAIAVALTVAAIAGLVVLAGRAYTGAWHFLIGESQIYES